jgi:hypothetical protein
MTHQIDPIAYDLVLLDLHARLARAHQDNQRLIHERDRLLAQLGTVAPMVNGTHAIVISCSRAGCTHLPISRKVLPPEDAIPTWLAGLGWGYTADGEAYLCPEHR